jgi:hypothetical protein
MPAYKGSTALSLTQSFERSVEAQVAFDFGTSIGGTASAEIYSLCVEVCSGLAITIGMSFSLQNAVTYEISQDEPTGYYKIGICQNIYRHTVHEIISIDEQNIYDMPLAYDAPYLALLYSDSSSSSGYRRY